MRYIHIGLVMSAVSLSSQIVRFEISKNKNKKRNIILSLAEWETKTMKERKKKKKPTNKRVMNVIVLNCRVFILLCVSNIQQISLNEHTIHPGQQQWVQPCCFSPAVLFFLSFFLSFCVSGRTEPICLVSPNSTSMKYVERLTQISHRSNDTIANPLCNRKSW